MTVSNCSFIGNDAGYGGAIYNLGTLTVTNSTFYGNGRHGGGSAIYTFSTPTRFGSVAIANSTFFGNLDGPAPYCAIATPNADAEAVSIVNSTFSGSSGCAIGVPAVLRNTVVANDHNGDNCAFAITDGGHNLDSGSSCGFNTENGSLSNTDPRLDPAGLKDNGGPTQTVALCTALDQPTSCTSASPAIDAGDPTVCAAAPVSNLDQRGVMRPGTRHTQCSIGAYEADASASGSAFTKITTGDIVTTPAWYWNGAWGDYDDDGYLDLFVGATFPDSAVVGDNGNSEGRTWVDYDNDRDLDLFVSNTAPFGSFLYRNEGNGVFVKVTDSGLSDRIEDTYGACWADYDNDGFTDLFLENGQKNSLYRNNADGTFTGIVDSAVVLEEIPSNAIFSSCAWGDYDNDGFIDLFVTRGDCYPAAPDCLHTPRAHNFLYRNDGDGTFTAVTQDSVVTDLTTQCPGASWGDYDNDGFLDLFVSQGAFAADPQTNLLYHNDGNGNAWLNVKLVGTVSNRSAIGAKVRVNASYRGQSRWQMGEIVSGDGESNQSNALNAAVGLGEATIIDTVRVEWPSGAVQELYDVVPRQFLTITEPYCAGDCDASGGAAVNELVTLVNIALGHAGRSACRRGVASSAAVDIALLIEAVNKVLNGCGDSANGVESVSTGAGQAFLGAPRQGGHG